MSDVVICCIIICTTIIIISLIIGYYSNKETKAQKIEDAKNIICAFKNNYCYRDTDNGEYLFKHDDKAIINFINTLKHILY